MKGIKNLTNKHQRNVKYVKSFSVLTKEKPKKFFPCPICKDKLLVKYTFKHKPYCICESCGVQLFVRSENGIKKFLKLI
jgi:transcription elongation factor Elf1